MGKQIEETVSKCEICQEHQISHIKKPMATSRHGRYIVAADLFQFKECDYFCLSTMYPYCFYWPSELSKRCREYLDNISSTKNQMLIEKYSLDQEK